ncbi:MAG: right-handed parallel beta-helix repeat-containing protein, partial [Verrucomicrobiota bacterium]
VTTLKVGGSTIQNCTYGIMTLINCNDVTFTKSTFKDNVEFDLVNLSQCRSVAFDSCKFTNNRADLEWDYSLFDVSDSSDVQLKNSTLTENMAPYFEATQGSVEIINTTQTANTFPKGEFKN